MRKPTLILLFTIIFLNACAPASGLPSAATGLAALPVIAGAEQTTTPDIIEVRQGSLWIRILSPREGSVMQQTQVDVSGQAAPNTLVNINGRELLVPPDQFFRLTLTLEPGLNTIQISASDATGNEINLSLTVTCQP